MLADAGGTAAEISEFWHCIWHLVNLPLLSHNNNTMPLRVFTRRHYIVLEAGGQFVVVGGWLVQAQGTPQNSINRNIRILRISSVLYRMGRLRSPYDPSLHFSYYNILGTSHKLGLAILKARYSIFVRMYGFGQP